MPHYIENKTKQRIPRVSFEVIKNYILGQDYELSLVFVKEATSKKLNSRYRHKNRPTNILSFPLSDDTGEILIDIKTVKKEVAQLKENKKKYLTYIFIHGLLHLKGFEHGSKMERVEKDIKERFSEK